MNIYEIPNLAASLLPNREALVCGDRRWDYEGLRREILAFAAGMQRLGIGRGSHVAAVATNSDRYIVALYGTAFLGATFYPLNNRAKGEELQRLVASAAPDLIVADARYLPLLGDSTELLVLDSSVDGTRGYVETLIAGGFADEDAAADVSDDDNAIVMFTAGTTAAPKAVPLTHGSLSAYVMNSADPAGEDGHYAQVLVAPFYHVAGLTSTLLSPWSGRKMVVLNQFEPTAWFEAVKQERVTHAFLVPTMVRRLLDDPSFAQQDLSSLETLTYGAAAMPTSTLLEAISRFPASVGFVNSYGQTETTATVAILGPDDHRLTGTPAEIEQKKRRLRSIGKPVLDVEMRIVDDNRQPVPTGVVGELAIHSARTMKGYLGEDGDREAARFDGEGWLYTSDLAWIDSDGYIFLSGRSSDLIIRGGENISPAEIEAALYEHPAISDVAVIGVPDEEWGERVVAYVTQRAGKSQAEESEIIAFCSERLASFKKPSEVRFLDDLPRSSVGKILKRELREIYARDESATYRLSS